MGGGPCADEEEVATSGATTTAYYGGATTTAYYGGVADSVNGAPNGAPRRHANNRYTW